MKTARFLFFAGAIIFSVQGSGQKTMWGANATMDFPFLIGDGKGGNLYGGLRMSKGIYAAGSLSIISFDELKKPYVITALKFVAEIPTAHEEKTKVLVFLEPGHSIYRDTYRLEYYPTEFDREGGFTLFGGLGAAFPLTGKLKILLSGGYSSFGFIGPEYAYSNQGPVSVGRKRFSVDGFALRLGLMGY